MRLAASPLSPSPTPLLPQRIVIDSECATVEELIARYRRFFTLDAWFVPSADLTTVGALATFSFLLASGAPVLRGVGRIVEVWDDPHNSFRSPGAWLGDLQTSPGCEWVLDGIIAGIARYVPFAEGTTQVRIDGSTTSSAKDRRGSPTLGYGLAPLRPPGS